MKPCSKHPRYQVKRQPKVPCESCWAIWTLTHYYHSLPPTKRPEPLSPYCSINTERADS